jgi:hypothetical protein
MGRGGAQLATLQAIDTRMRDLLPMGMVDPVPRSGQLPPRCLGW